LTAGIEALQEAVAEHSPLTTSRARNQVDRRSSLLHYRRGRVCLRLDRADAAEADFLRATELCPTAGKAFLGLGAARMRLGLYAQAGKTLLDGLKYAQHDVPEDRKPGQPRIALRETGVAYGLGAHAPPNNDEHSAVKAHDLLSMTCDVVHSSRNNNNPLGGASLADVLGGEAHLKSTTDKQGSAMAALERKHKERQRRHQGVLTPRSSTLDGDDDGEEDGEEDGEDRQRKSDDENEAAKEEEPTEQQRQEDAAAEVEAALAEEAAFVNVDDVARREGEFWRKHGLVDLRDEDILEETLQRMRDFKAAFAEVFRRACLIREVSKGGVCVDKPTKKGPTATGAFWWSPVWEKAAPPPRVDDTASAASKKEEEEEPPATRTQSLTTPQKISWGAAARRLTHDMHQPQGRLSRGGGAPSLRPTRPSSPKPSSSKRTVAAALGSFKLDDGFPPANKAVEQSAPSFPKKKTSELSWAVHAATKKKEEEQKAERERKEAAEKREREEREEAKLFDEKAELGVPPCLLRGVGSADERRRGLEALLLENPPPPPSDDVCLGRLLTRRCALSGSECLVVLREIRALALAFDEKHAVIALGQTLGAASVRRRRRRRPRWRRPGGV